jgi:membrane fusion protein (multidrug efflux system)
MYVDIRVGRMFVIRFCVFMLSLYSLSLYAAPANKRQPPTVEVQTITRSTIEQDLSALAILKAHESVLLKPEVAGRVVTINFNEGQTVSKGQLLVQLDDDLLQAELVSQQANLALTQTEYQRYQRYFCSNKCRL